MSSENTSPACSEAITFHNTDSRSPYVIVCEHASSFIPDEYKGLGLPPQATKEHIGWDIHAMDMATIVAGLLDSPLISAPVSRLVADLNRPETCQECIPTRSETTSVPGNLSLTLHERENRLSRWHRPFHQGLSTFLEDRIARGIETFLVGIHSFTPVYAGVPRTWAAGVLYRASHLHGETVAQAMEKQSGALVGRNQPYDLWQHSNHTIPFHGDRRGLAAVIVEIRNDLLATTPGLTRWAGITAQALQKSQTCPLPPANRQAKTA